MLVIGVTGGSGSGKSEITKLLKRKGALIISGDEIGRRVVETNPGIKAKLVKAFGTGILDAGGKLNRKKLARIAFSTQTKTKRLNQIVHPLLLKELRSQIAKARKAKNAHKYAIVDAALITEWGLEKALDVTVAVVSPTRLRIQRLTKAGLSPREASDRIARQHSDQKRQEIADFVIINRGPLKTLRAKALRLHHTLLAFRDILQLESVVGRFDRHTRR